MPFSPSLFLFPRLVILEVFSESLVGGCSLNNPQPRRSVLEPGTVKMKMVIRGVITTSVLVTESHHQLPKSRRYCGVLVGWGGKREASFERGKGTGKNRIKSKHQEILEVRKCDVRERERDKERER